MKEPKKECLGWKVVDQSRSSISTSAIYTVKYEIGIFTKPKLEGSKLFFFKYKKDAEHFAKLHPFLNPKIVKCAVKNPSKAYEVPYFTNTFKKYWENQPMHPDNLIQAPKGTYFADEIKCLE